MPEEKNQGADQKSQREPDTREWRSVWAPHPLTGKNTNVLNSKNEYSLSAVTTALAKLGIMFTVNDKNTE